jgi:hypothetical protein
VGSLSFLQRLFGKEEGEKLWNVYIFLGGLVGLVVSVVAQAWWTAALAAVLVVWSGVDLLRERRRRAYPSAANPSHLNPFHHEPLPPFPGTPDDETE